MTDPRIARLVAWCPVYDSYLQRYPADKEWLLHPQNGAAEFRFVDFRAIWEREFQAIELQDENTLLRALQRFRRRMCLRIAFREINDLARVSASLEELSRLAEFVLQTL